MPIYRLFVPSVPQLPNVPLIAPQTLFEGRIRRLDMRVTKIFKLTNRVKLQANLDAYNALNSSAIQTYNQNFILGGAWLTPTLILPARFAKITAQIDF